MSLFAPYPARPGDVGAYGDRLIAGARAFTRLAGSLAGGTRRAAAQAGGVLEQPVAGIDRRAAADAARLSSLSLVAGGALRSFAGAITTYNNGVSGLNEQYERARSTGVGPDLVRTLRSREAELTRDLDVAAEDTARLLRAAPESPEFRGALSRFGATTAYRPSTASVIDVGAAVWDRGSTLAVYAWDTAVRRVSHPMQTLWDSTTGTTVLEDVVALESILVEDGELYREGPYARDAAFITGVAVPGGDAAVLGHTVRVVGDGPPDPAHVVEHETQHVRDLEDVGAVGFYATQLGEYAANLIDGYSEYGAYRNIGWERRAHDVEDDPTRTPEGVGGPISDAIDAVDGLFR